MHTDQLLITNRLHGGEIPRSWSTGDTPFQKAAVIAAVAWHDIKDPELPELTSCDPTFRQQCIGIVESLMRGNAPDDSLFAIHADELWKQTNDYTKENHQ